jgi:hypothetical protein
MHGKKAKTMALITLPEVNLRNNQPNGYNGSKKTNRTFLLFLLFF